jgi:hypothetical protein
VKTATERLEYKGVGVEGMGGVGVENDESTERY